MGLSIGPQKDMSCFVGLHDESMCVIQIYLLL